jgi:hypothetical protein
MTTIVSSFVTNVNKRKERNLTAYVNYGKLLLKSKTKKIIFLDEEMYSLISTNDYDENNTKIIQIKKENSYLYSFVDKLDNFLVNTTCPEKDTIEFMFTMCNKTEWIRDAILIDENKSDNYVWIDFGIKHVFKGTDEEFIKCLDEFQNKKYEKIRIGSIWDLNLKVKIDLFKDISWYFAGGVIGGDKEKLIIFADKMKEKCEDIMTYLKTIMWEVNIWYIIYSENPELFTTYKCGHDNLLLTNY